MIKPDKLSAAVSALDRNPRAGFAFADFESIDEKGGTIKPSVLADYLAWPTLTRSPLELDWRLIPREQLARALVAENFIGTSGVIVRKAQLDEIGTFDESLAYSEDRDLWFRLAHRCDALFWNRIARRSAGRTTSAPFTVSSGP